MSNYKTPLRYPGGKQRLAPFLSEILIANDLVGGDYVEPYAGGAGAAIELLLNKSVSQIHLNDSSIPIFSFWNSILKCTDDFCRLISSASLTVEEWKRQREIIRNPTAYTELDVAFSTFYLNRCNRSGVLSGGVIGGIEQTGDWKMDARFSRNQLIARIESIAYMRDSIHVSNLDAEEYIEQYIPQTPENTLIYYDPPYFEKASGLYLDYYSKEDHQRLAKVIQARRPRKWVLSYDGAEEILSYYCKRKLFLYDLQYNAATVYKGKEVFIFSDSLRLPNSSCLSYINEGLSRLAKQRKLLKKRKFKP